jgi:hypothetical protein
MYIIHLKPDQPEALSEAMKGGGATKRVSSTIYNIPSTYTGENLGLLIRTLTVIFLVINFKNRFTSRMHRSL